MYRKTVGRSAPRLHGGAGRIVTIGLPAPYEGVGKALRSAYRPAAGEMPDDMLALLAKLG